MFNFFLILAGHHVIHDIAGLPSAGANSKPSHYKRKVQKKKDLQKIWVLTGKQFEDFRQKNDQNQYSRPFKKPKWGTSTLKPTTENRACIQ